MNIFQNNYYGTCLKEEDIGRTKRYNLGTVSFHHGLDVEKRIKFYISTLFNTRNDFFYEYIPRKLYDLLYLRT